MLRPHVGLILFLMLIANATESTLDPYAKGKVALWHVTYYLTCRGGLVSRPSFTHWHFTAAGSRLARERTAGGAERRCGRYGEGSEGGSGRARYARDTGGAGQGAIRSEARTAVAAASAPDESDTERAAERYM